MTAELERCACVAGGTSGLGKAIVIALRQKGYRVLAVGRGTAHAEELRAELGEGDGLRIRSADLTSPEGAAEIAADAEQAFGRLDLLVNSVGTISRGGIEVDSFEDWRRVLSTNLDPLFLVSKACLPLLLRGKNPSIVNLSSMCGTKACTSISYSVSKAGTDMFTRCMAKDLAGRGVRVNTVSPGVVPSNLQVSAGMFSPEELDRWLEGMKAMHPLGRLGTSEEVAAAVLYLASEEAAWITGANLAIDGGRTVL